MTCCTATTTTPKLGDMSSMAFLGLGYNGLSGGIPPGLGNLSNLAYLYLQSNRLSGEIPVELENLSALFLLNLQWNALHSDDAALITFLNSKHYGDWQSTQTVAPVNLSVDSVGDHTVWLSWDAVSYQIDPGGYEVFSAPTGTGVWTSSGWTEPKTSNTFPITGLDPGTIYDLAVLTYTAPHADNLNLVHSDFSPGDGSHRVRRLCPADHRARWGRPDHPFLVGELGQLPLEYG